MIHVVKRELRIVEYDTGKVAKRWDITDWPERRRDRLESGVNINLDHERYYTVQCDGDDEQEGRSP